MKLANHLSADRIGGMVGVIFGAAVVYGSWVMDRLDSLKIPPSTVPGVVPGLLGIGIVIFGVVLLVRRIPAEAPSFAEVKPEEPPPIADDGIAWKRLMLNWVLCVTYAGLLLGQGIHYTVLTTGFLLLHFLLMDETEQIPAQPDLRRVIMAAVLAPVIAIVIAQLFQRVFLVRLP